MAAKNSRFWGQNREWRRFAGGPRERRRKFGVFNAPKFSKSSEKAITEKCLVQKCAVLRTEPLDFPARPVSGEEHFWVFNAKLY